MTEERRITPRRVGLTLAWISALYGVALLLYPPEGIENWQDNTWGLFFFLTPIVLTQVYARLRRFDRSIEEASMDLGANRRQTLIRVTLPNIRTAMLGSALLVYTLSFDEVAITFFLTGTDNTLPMHIWSMLREGVTPEINAIATITIAVSIVLIVLSLRLLRAQKGPA